MSVDFDRSDFEFNEDIDNTAQTTDTEPVEPIEEGDEAPEEEETAAGGLSPIRIVILVLILLLLLCAVCFLAYRVLPPDVVGQLPPIFGQPTPTQVQVSPTTVPTDESPLPTDPSATEAPTDEAPLPTEEPTEGPTVIIDPDEPTPTPEVEPTDEGETPTAPTATTAPVPGPTSTPGPTVVVTISMCDNNIPPEADANGPYDAMQGKGQAIVDFDGSGSLDQDGEIVRYEWDFGDGSDREFGETVRHGYTETGKFVATLKVTDNCGDMDEDTVDVTIVGPTPPADGTPTAGTATPTAPAGSTSGTVGWCYRVQYGDTLTGIAHRYGVSVRDLAFVNGVNMNYFVIAGQGLFIPTGDITTAGPNVYQVQSGDTMNSVAYQCGLTTVSLASANGLSTDASLTPGQMLLIPPWNYR